MDATYCWPWQVGQSGQPSPEPVSLTAPPVTMITERPTRAKRASFLNRLGEILSFCDRSDGTHYMLDEIAVLYQSRSTAPT